MLTPEHILRLQTRVPDAVRENEGRRSDRRPYPADMLVTLGKRLGGRSIEVRVRDLSGSGVGLIAPVAIPPGEQFVGHFVSRQTRKPVPVVCTACYCREMPGKRYAVGAKFEPDAAGVSDKVSEKAELPRGLASGSFRGRTEGASSPGFSGAQTLSADPPSVR